jgi:hypothetical protein
MKQFDLDEHRYPEFLAGPAEPDPNNAGAWLPISQSSGTLSILAPQQYPNYPASLYPTYIKSVTQLVCPNAPTAAQTSVIVDPLYAYLGGLSWPAGMAVPKRARGYTPTGGGGATPFNVYAYSSYDYQVPPDSAAGGEIHYSIAWSNQNPSTTTDPAALQNISRQLMWRNPPSETVITWCSYHRDMNQGTPSSGSRDVVLFLDGHVMLKPSTDFLNTSGTGWQSVWATVTPTSG